MKKTINMFAQLKTPKTMAKGVRPGFLLVTAILLVAILMAGLSVTTWIKGKSLDDQIAEKEGFISSGDNLLHVAESQELQRKIVQYNQYNEINTQVQDALRFATRFDSKTYALINSVRPSHIEITGVAFAENVVSVNCKTPENIPPADYAAALDGLGAFYAVSYHGFSQSSDGYTFTIVCVLMGGGATS